MFDFVGLTLRFGLMNFEAQTFPEAKHLWFYVSVMEAVFETTVGSVLKVGISQKQETIGVCTFVIEKLV